VFAPLVVEAVVQPANKITLDIATNTKAEIFFIV
jgi:hypothetical protein